MALISGVALQEVCDVAGWSSTAHIHQILLFGPGLYPRFPGALVLVLLFRFHTGQALVAMVCYIDVPLASESMQREFP